VLPSVEFHLIRETEELIDFIPKWQVLFARDPDGTPFQSPEWLVPWWRSFQDELSAVVIARDGVIAGFLPFYVYHDISKHQRQMLLLGAGTTDYLDGVFAPECSTEEIGRAVEWLCAEVHNDVFCATQLQPRSRLLEALEVGSGSRDQGSRGYRQSEVFLSRSEPCSRMKAAKISQLPQKIRRNAMYYRNRALRRGSLELIQADESNWKQIFAELVRLHTLQWRSRGEDGVLVDQRVVTWHRETIPQLLRAGMLRLMALLLNGEMIAVLYSLVDRKREGRMQYFYITAYSPGHADLRPGTLLIAYAVEHAVREGIATIDMLRGDEAYKEIWHMEKVPTWCCTQFAASRADSDRAESAA
jgi:CelD/BcsL family acetyltransferase involved in cellulose biosynthesis